MIAALARRIALLHGGSRLGLAFVAGALAALAMPPIGAFPVLALSFPVAIFLIDGAAGPRGLLLPALRQAFALGWVFGFGYFLAGLWWIGAAFLVDAESYAFLLPVAVLALPAGLALFHAAGFVLARLIWPVGPARILSFAASMALAELARGVLLTGFPWNAFGYALAGEIHLAQTLSLIGLPALTLVALAVFASPAALADAGRWRIGAPTLAVGVLVAMAAFGLARLAGDGPAMVEGVRLRLMQPAIPQDAKFRPSLRDEIMATYVKLSERTTGPGGRGLEDVTHLIWPESAFPFIVSRDADALAMIAAMLPPDTVLLTGAGRADDPLPGDLDRRFYNSLHVIDTDGAILDSYDKVHLVPFGEYLPFQSALESIGLRQLTRLRGGFTPGARLRTLTVPGAPPVGVLICYEAIFAGNVTDPDRRPGWLLNVTNDAWFGITPGPYQHLVQARARAIEEGLPLVRAANNGISAVFDARGRNVAMLSLGPIGVVDSPLPAAEPPTYFATFRNKILASLVVFCLIVPIVAKVRQRRKRVVENGGP